MGKKRIPRIIVTGTNSGSGKTTVSLAVLSALSRRGLRVQPFKVGPDYIDHKFHGAVAGRESRNLDSWMCGDAEVRRLFEHHAQGVDLALIEGVMGLYDGYGGTELTGSTHDIAEIVGAPVILVIQARGMSLSACAMIEGYRSFGGYDRVGVIFNGVVGDASYQMLRQNVRRHLGDAVVPLGYLPRNPQFALPERHLGLHVVGHDEQERERFRSIMDRLGDQAEQSIDLDALMRYAEELRPARSVVSAPQVSTERTGGPVRLGVAYDDAFHFYYPDNFDRLREEGAELVFFRPLEDAVLPEVDGIYIGGGYPELYAEALESNASMRASIRAAAEDGMPIYAECGGLMYLSKSIRTLDGRDYAMCGVLDLETRMTKKLARFGYEEATLRMDTVLGPEGTLFRGHEFHYSEIAGGDAQPTYYDVRKYRRTNDGEGEEWTLRSWTEGYGIGDQILASYLHIHFGTNRNLAAHFVNRCRRWRGR